MKFVNDIEKKISEDISLRNLIKIALLFTIVWLVLQTGSFWGFLLGKIWAICKPFALGFIFAYILIEPITWGTKKGIPEKLMTAVVYTAILLLLFWLLSSLIPMIINRASDFINAMIDGFNLISEKLTSLSRPGDTEWLNTIVEQAVNGLRNAQGLIPDISRTLPDILHQMMDSITVFILAVVISIFMCLGWDKIRSFVNQTSLKISDTFHAAVFDVNHEIRTYVRSLLILMIIKAVEYSLIYLLCGHPDWLILALLTAISLLVPYLGPTIINLIGILTALAFPGAHALLLVVILVVMSNVDAYVIEPMVHSHNTAVTPLWALFSVFAGGVIAGAAGIVVSIPVFLSIRILVKKYWYPSFIHHKEEQA